MTVDNNSLRELFEVIGDDYESMLELVDSFFTDAPDLIAGMSDGLKTNNSIIVARSAHTMKSNCRDFGLFELADSCFELEKMGKAGELGSAVELVEKIKQLYDCEKPDLLEAVNELKQ